LLEAVKEGKSAEDADCFLRPYLLMVLILGMPQLALKAPWALFVEIEDASVVTLTFCSCQDEMEGLRWHMSPV